MGCFDYETTQVTYSEIIRIENQPRRENLIFDGITESESETWEDSEKKIYEVLSKMDISDYEKIKF